MWDSFRSLGFVVCFGVPTALAIAFYVVVARGWRRRVNEQTISLNGEAFRNPTNLGVTITGILLPLAAAGTAYLQSRTSPDTSALMGPLLAGLLLLFGGMAWGLWNSYAIATQVDQHDMLVVNASHNSDVPASFVGQFVMTFFGVLVISGTGLLAMPFSVRSPDPHQDRPTVLAHPHVYVGMSRMEVLERWGLPRAQGIGDAETEGEILVYDSVGSEYRVVIGADGVTTRVTQESK